MCHPPPPTQATQPPAQATSGSVYYQFYKEMDLNGAHQEDLQTAKSMIC
jgi:hypothetical protein